MIRFLLPFVLIVNSLQAVNPQHFSYQDHDYIQFENGSIVHSPDCIQCRSRIYANYEYAPGLNLIQRLEVSPYRHYFDLDPAEIN